MPLATPSIIMRVLVEEVTMEAGRMENLAAEPGRFFSEAKARKTG